MEQDFLKTQIEKRAEDRFNREWKAFIEFNKNNCFGKYLKVNASSEPINIFNFGSNSGLFNESMYNNISVAMSNYTEIKKLIIERFVKEETEQILSKLDHLSYLFNQA